MKYNEKFILVRFLTRFLCSNTLSFFPVFLKMTYLLIVYVNLHRMIAVIIAVAVCLLFYLCNIKI